MMSLRNRSNIALLASTITLCLSAIIGPANASFENPHGLESSEQQSLGINTTLVKHPFRLIAWVYNPTNSPTGFTDDAAVVALLEAAMAEWEGVCGIDFVRANATGIDNTIVVTNTADGTIAYGWDAGIAPAAGLAGPSWSTNPGFIIAFGYSPALDGSLRLEPGAFDETGLNAAQIASNQISWHATAVHELGHLMGFGHSDNPDSVMFANPYNSISHITQDDIDGCRAVYGYPGINVTPADNAQYDPPTVAPGGTFEFNHLAIDDSIVTPITEIDGSDENLWIFYQENTAGPEITMTAIIVDPRGFASLHRSDTLTPAGGRAITIGHFSRYREIPGTWNIYVFRDGVYEGLLPITVTTGLPAWNGPPTGTVTYTDQPALRQVALTANITAADPAATTLTAIWHIPTIGEIALAPIPVGSLPFNHVQNVQFFDQSIYDISLEISDDVVRYDGTGPGNTGPAGDGFQTLIPYYSHGTNRGPDFTGDNISDVLWWNQTSGQVNIWGMGGDSVEQNVNVDVVSDTSWKIKGTGDQNGDGKMDILWRADNPGEMVYWEMDGGTIVSRTTLPPVGDLNWKIKGNGDYDGDGLSDIMWYHENTGQVYFWKMNDGVVVSPESVTTVTDLDWEIVGNGDYNSDGRNDLLWRHALTGQVNYWQMNGSQVQDNKYVDTVSPGLNWNIVGDGDYNGDTTDDVLWYRTGDGKVFYWQMDNGAVAARQGVTFVNDPGWQIVNSNGDYDNNGSSDVLWYYGPTGQVNLWLMIGPVITGISSVDIVSDPDWSVVNVD